MEAEDQEIIEANNRLMRMRKEKVVQLRPEPIAITLEKVMPGISPTEAVSGEKCKIHHLTLVNERCEVCDMQAETARKRREDAERRAEEKRREIQERVHNSIRLGRRYQGVTFADYHATTPEAENVLQSCRRYAETFTERRENGDSLLLLGSPGTGKNMLSAAICNAIAENKFSSLHTTASKLVRRIKDSWKSKEELEQEIINSFIAPDFLVIDEIGIQFGSKTEELYLFEVLNGRYEDKKPTCLISNLNVNGVETFLGARVMDRFYEGKSSVLEFTWPSYRRR